MTSLPSREVTLHHFLSRDGHLLRVTALEELKRTQNSTYRFLHPFPGDFRSNEVTSGSLPVMWGHATSFPVTRRPPPMSYTL